MYEEGLTVPLLVHWPGGEIPPGRVPGPVSQLDIVPTLLDALRFQVEPGSYAGRSWLDGRPTGEVRAACYRKCQCLAGVRGKRKLIHYFDNRPDELFDLATDPNERKSLADEHPEEVAEWRAELVAWSRAVREMHQPFGEARLQEFVCNDAPSPRQVLTARFGDWVELVGVDAPTETVGAGRRFDVTYYFKALAPIPAGHIIYVRATGDPPNEKLDHVPVNGLYPMADWKPGEYVSDWQRLRVPSRWKERELVLCVGVSKPGGGLVPVQGEGATPEGCVEVARVKVRPKQQKKKRRR